MLFPRKKAEDMATRALMLEVMAVCLRTGNVEDAKAIGEASQKMAKKIAGTYPTRSWEEYETLLATGQTDIPTYAEFKLGTVTQ